MKIHRVLSTVFAYVSVSRAVFAGTTLWDEALHPGTIARAEELDRATASARAADGNDHDALVQAENARARFASVLSSDPANDRARVGLAEMLDRLGRYDDELAVLSGVLDRNDSGSGAYASLCAQLGIAATRRSDFALARRAYERFVAVVTDDARRYVGLCNLAEVLQPDPDPNLSIRTYERCIAIAPWVATGWWGLAVALDHDARSGEALDAVRRALSADSALLHVTGPGVFFVPACEQTYYLALACEASAGAGSCAHLWSRYLVTGGSAAPWADRARWHLAHISPSEISGRSPRRTPTPSRSRVAPATRSPSAPSR